MIPVKNVYYMLSYAFQVLNEAGFAKLGLEEFDNIEELCAAILIQGISIQIKRGLGREFINQEDALSTVKGRIEIGESIKTNSITKSQLVCSYDDFSVNSVMNRVIKTTIQVLLKEKLDTTRKRELRKLMPYFSEVDYIDLHTVDWHMHYNRNNQTYRMLMLICYLVFCSKLQGKIGNTKMMDFEDIQRKCKLYERFILEYYKREYMHNPKYKGFVANASEIEWKLEEGDSKEMLPMMKSDIMISYGTKTLIIDAKYYESSLQTSQFGVSSLHSSNLYQIFTYVKNKQASVDKDHSVSGMLLYAKTDAEMIPKKNEYCMSGNVIIADSLDLNTDFSEIKKSLDDIAEYVLI